MKLLMPLTAVAARAGSFSPNASTRSARSSRRSSPSSASPSARRSRRRASSSSCPSSRTSTGSTSRVLEWDGNPSDMPTKDKLYISVDLFARWKITDPLQYFLRLRDERSAQSRLDDILGSETRNAVAKHELIEIIRTTKGRTPLRDSLLTDEELAQDIGALVPIIKGRALVEQEIFAAAAEKVRVFGIELLDIRFKRINYNESVRPKIYDRMISERRQIAERFLSEGNGEAARIRGNRVRDLNKIQSEAYRAVEEIRGLPTRGRRHLRPRPMGQTLKPPSSTSSRAPCRPTRT
jgi:membrane protease subunit HflC